MKRISWWVLGFGGLMVAFGAKMISQGVTAYQVGAIIPRSGKFGPMTGLESIVAGAITAITALSFMGYEFFKKVSNSRQVYEIGKYEVMVEKKNSSLGIQTSLNLSCHDDRTFVFHCTDGRVAAALLNDFIIGQKVELDIKTEDGECYLVGRNAYAHGFISLRKGEK